MLLCCASVCIMCLVNIYLYVIQKTFFLAAEAAAASAMSVSITVSPVEVLNGDAQDCYCVITFGNNSPYRLWGMYSSFFFGGRLTCPIQFLEEDLEPGEVRRRKLRFHAGFCAALDEEVVAHALLTGRVIPPVHPLVRDVPLEYTFNISLWPVNPADVNVEMGPDPSTLVVVHGDIVVPRGTMSDYCVHHTVEPYPY